MNQKPVKVMKRPDYLKVSSELDPWLKKNGYYRKQIAKDASCLFRIVAEHVFLLQDKHKVVRSNTCDYLIEKKNLFAHMVDGVYEDYVENMRDYATYGTEVEIAAMSLLYEKDFAIFEEVDQPPRKATQNNFKDVIMLCVQDGRQYSAVYQTECIDVAGNIQSMVHEKLYKEVFNHNSVTEEKTKLLEQKGKDRGINENLISYQAAKSLEPKIYRNSDFDVWAEQAKDEAKNGVRFKNGLGAGSKVKIQLYANHKEYEGYIQKIPYEGAPVNVFVSELGSTKSVPYDSLIPVVDPPETPTSQSSRSLPGSPAPIRAPAFQSPQFQGPLPPQHYSGAPFHHPQYSRTPPFPPHNYIRPPPVYPSNPNYGDRKRSNFSYRHNEGGGRSYGMNPLPPRYQQQAGPRHYNNEGRTYPNRTLNNNTKTGNRCATEVKKEPDSKTRRPKETEDSAEAATPTTSEDNTTEKSKTVSEGAQPVVSVAGEKKALELTPRGSYDRRRRRTDDDRSSHPSRYSNRANNIPIFQNGPGVSVPLIQGTPCPLPSLIQNAPCRPPFVQNIPEGVHYASSTTSQRKNSSTAPLTISLAEQKTLTISGTQPQTVQDPNSPLTQVPYGLSMYPLQFPQYPASQPPLVNVGDGVGYPSNYAPVGGVYPPSAIPQPYPVPCPIYIGGTPGDVNVQVAQQESFVSEMRSSPTSSGYNSAPMSPEDRARTYNMGVRFPTTIPVAVQGAVPPASYELPRITDVQEQFQQMSLVANNDVNVQFYTGQPMINQPHAVNNYPACFLPQPPYFPFEFGPNNN